MKQVLWGEILKGEPNAKQRVEKLYGPVFEWLSSRLQPGQVTYVGLNAPQGAGKTTLTRVLTEAFAQQDIKALAISVDDFYFTRQQQVTLAAKHSSNPYLQQRGYPGTHDIALGEKILHQVRALADGSECSIPRYDKSAFNGQGDRFSIEHWSKIIGPVDLLILEGWFLGFQSVDFVEDPHLRQCNQNLNEYASWLQDPNGFIYLQPQEVEFVVDWRIEAEEKMKRAGKTGMTTEQVRAYVEKFLPAYQVWANTITPQALKIPNFLHYMIGKNRLPE